MADETTQNTYPSPEFEGDPANLPVEDYTRWLAPYSAGPDLLVGLDVDGTILHHDTTLSARVREAVQAHIAGGTHIVIATGRGVQATQIALEALGIDSGIAVVSNGAMILSIGESDDGLETTEFNGGVASANVPVRLLRAHTFHPREEIELIAKGLPEAVIAVESLSGPTRISGPFPEGEMLTETVLVPVDELVVPDTTRVTIRAPHMSALEMLEAIQDLGLQGVEYAVGWSAWMDLAPTGINKAVGLQEVADILGTRASITVGDSGNDCEMLAWADVGVAMGNARPYVASFADTMAPHVDDDGLAVVLEELL
ncbi:hydroxymethylpyrimidine pyrophosphatase-like HAD family hydrolase [Trueperella bonasi]|uniref:Hydroxymethylpyrimidine pyrophosphatase-like HAD family hydrolase n=1 Tax=Trueperella bonasi TaxID=312286 RepID=A0ABT9NFW4_9ACTO|nr:HAD family hydrolase [Trueperella bonasi]MDP9806285.1 hydroxymethylpyrimidine pyrophosphatase-like HAD family hydrolase [Trueperella bonasi]